jgi:hypothetical protein
MHRQQTTVVAPSDRISHPHMGRECVDPPHTVYLDRSVEITFIFIFVCTDIFRHGLHHISVRLRKRAAMPLPLRTEMVLILQCRVASVYMKISFFLPQYVYSEY